ncbi:MAG: ankyrin repeat domain-containing protein, partial [Alphaproteobacteria bacterium]|nr:ankyrin repeat domain-containing protein [Alphaproteobacteria bacterium]
MLKLFGFKEKAKKQLAQKIMDAILESDITRLEKLIKQGAPIDEADQKGWTPLRLAIFKRQLEIAKKLIEAGADVNAVDKDGDPLIHMAVLYDHVEIAKELIKAGANVNATNKGGWTALQS